MSFKVLSNPTHSDILWFCSRDCMTTRNYVESSTTGELGSAGTRPACPPTGQALKPHSLSPLFLMNWIQLNPWSLSHSLQVSFWCEFLFPCSNVLPHTFPPRHVICNTTIFIPTLPGSWKLECMRFLRVLMGRYTALCSQSSSLPMDLPFPYGLCLCTIFPSANPKLLHMAIAMLAYETNSWVHQLTW